MASFNFDGHTYSDTNGRFFCDGKRISAKVYSDAVESAVAAKKAAKASEPKEKKPRAPRKPKDIAFEHGAFTLTSKQVDFIKHLFDMMDSLTDSVWTDEVVEEIGGQFESKPMTVGAMFSTICEKGLGTRGKEKRERKTCTYFAFTAEGIEVVEAMGIK